MKPKWRKLFLQIVLVILLTGLCGCALIFPRANPLDRDPVALAALQEYEGTEGTQSTEGAAFRRTPRQERMIEEAISSDQLAVGMKMDEVQSVWGSPREIERAGDSHSGNQRWVYPGGVSSQWKMQPSRYVYFENGQVTGWENSTD